MSYACSMRISSEPSKDSGLEDNAGTGDDSKLEELNRNKQLDDMHVHGRKQSLRARYVYGFIFFATNLLAWFFRDYGAKYLHLLQSKYIFIHTKKMYNNIKNSAIGLYFLMGTNFILMSLCGLNCKTIT